MKKFEDMGKLWKRSRCLFYSLCIGLVGIFCLQSLVKTYKYREANQTYKQIAEAVASNSGYKEEIAVEELNIIGWIKIDQLDISYPVVQGEDNEFYLQHLVNGKSNASGSIMLNCDNKATFADQNTIIYGHNMKDGSMFGRLKRFTVLTGPFEDFQIETANRELSCHIFAVACVEVSHPVFQIKYEEESFQYCMQELKKDASYWEEPGAEPGNIVTLSTCMGDRRLVVVAFVRE